MKPNRAWTAEDVERVAREMYEDGSSSSERYSDRAWASREWPGVDDYSVHKAISCYLKFMRAMDEYLGNPLPEYKNERSTQTGPSWLKKT